MKEEWHSRGYLPHWEAGEIAQSITFRVADSLPAELLQRWRDELKGLSEDKIALKRRARIEEALDRGHGAVLLSHPAVAELVERSLLHFDIDRYKLHAWSIMPNHVHVLVTPVPGQTLSAITHSWKSFSAKKANALLCRGGTFWAPEYFDRAIRDAAHYQNALGYIAMNPVKAGLRDKSEDWRFSSFWSGRKSGRDVRAPRRGG